MAEANSKDTQSFINKVGRNIFSPERTTEFLVGQFMMAFEISHDMSLFPEKWHLTPDQVRPQPADPTVK